ncbi:MAG TPA: hypothetical protein PKD76_03035 [Solirubrobacterales bacterium]|nr:hypothetical protein [Solirubrobacterales bacterium]
MSGPSREHKPGWPVRLVVTLTATALFLMAAQPATAAAPKGTYECYTLGYWFKLKGDHKYTVQTGGGGKWGGKQANVSFTTGPMKFAYGKFRKDPTGAPVIDIYFKSDKSYAGNCPKI